MGLDVLGELLGPAEQLGLRLALRGRDLLAEGLLLGAQLLEAGERGASALVGLEDGVDERGVVPAGSLAGTDDVGVLTELAEVDHTPRVSTRDGRR